MPSLLAPIRRLARAGVRSIMVPAVRELVRRSRRGHGEQEQALRFRSWRSSRYRRIRNEGDTDRSPADHLRRLACLGLVIEIFLTGIHCMFCAFRKCVSPVEEDSIQRGVD
jgi:hypothetical protein